MTDDLSPEQVYARNVLQRVASCLKKGENPATDFKFETWEKLDTLARGNTGFDVDELKIAIGNIAKGIDVENATAHFNFIRKNFRRIWPGFKGLGEKDFVPRYDWKKVEECK